MRRAGASLGAAVRARELRDAQAPVHKEWRSGYPGSGARASRDRAQARGVAGGSEAPAAPPARAKLSPRGAPSRRRSTRCTSTRPTTTSPRPASDCACGAIGRRRVQTLKGERSAIGGLFERTEIEVPIDADEPDLERIPDPELRARVIEIAEGKPLVAVFRTEFRRTRRALRKGESEWTLDLDEGVIEAGDETRSRPRGGARAARGRSRAAVRVRARCCTTSSACARPRAARQSGAMRSRAARARPRTIRGACASHADATLEDALAAILSQCLAHFTANADCAAEGVDRRGRAPDADRRAARARGARGVRAAAAAERACASSAPSCAGSAASSARRAISTCSRARSCPR